MSNIQTHHANGREYLLIPIWEHSHKHHVDRPIPDADQVLYYRLIGDEHSDPWQDELLPPGNWSIIGKASELSEQQASELVERNPDSYRNYDLPFGLPTAKESLSSLLSSLGMGEGNTLILVKQ